MAYQLNIIIMKKYVLPFLALMVLSACEGEDDDNDSSNDQQTAPEAFNPTPNQPVDAVFIALNTGSTVEVPFFGPQTVYTGTAVANSNDQTDMGTVSAEGTELTNNGNGNYFYRPGVTDTEGINFSRPVDWEVGGGSTVGSFNYSYSASVPEVEGVAGDENGELDLSQTVTLSYSSDSDLGSADSLYFMIYDAVGNFALKRSGANTTSMSFTTAETSALADGFGYIQVNAFTYTVENEGGATCAFIAQGTNTKTVTLK
jgi:hypothetical protein